MNQTRGSEKVWVATTYYNDLLQHRVIASKEEEQFRKDILARAVLAYISKTEKKAYEEWLPAFVESQKQMVERQIAECYYDEHLKHREYTNYRGLDTDICEYCKAVYVTADEAAAYDEWYNTEKAYMDTLTAIPVEKGYQKEYLSHRKTIGNNEPDEDIASWVITTYVTDEEKQAYQAWYADKASYIATLHCVESTLDLWEVNNALHLHDFPFLSTAHRSLYYLTDDELPIFEKFRYEHEKHVRTVPYSYYKSNLNNRYYEEDSYDSREKTVDVKITDKEWYEYTHKDEIIQESIQTLNLPILEGSEKQVRWAMEIRQEYLDQIKKEVEDWKKYASENMNDAYIVNQYVRDYGITSDEVVAWMQRIIDQLVVDMVYANDENLKNNQSRFWIDNRSDLDNLALDMTDSVVLAMMHTESEADVAEKLAEEKASKEAEEERKRLEAEEAKRKAEEEFRRTHKVVKVKYRYYVDYLKADHKITQDGYDADTRTMETWLTESDITDYNKWLDHHDISRMQLVEMPYIEYKKTWSKYRYKEYNEVTGTVTVYLPKDMEYVRTVSKHYEDRHAFRKGYIKELDIVPDTIDPDSIDVVIPDELIAEVEA